MIDRLLWNPSKQRFASVLGLTTLAVYVLIATGATIASTDMATCTQWPICLPDSGALFTVAFIVEFGHRALTGLVGVLIVLLLVGSTSLSLDWRVRIALYGSIVTFPVQIAIGGLLVFGDVPYIAELHLALGAVMFTCLLTALAWVLEPGTGEHEAGIDTTSVSQEEPIATSENAGQADHSWVKRGRAYLELTKPRLMWLLCLLALAGMALATTSGEWPTGAVVSATLAGGVLAIGASGTFNHLYERDRDRKMERTSERPVATSQIPVRNAALFGAVQVVLSLLLLVLFVNILAALLTFVAIVYYSVVYTVVLKPNTSWNIAIGGGAGALPALIGWVAVTGSIGLGGLLLAGLVVLWTPAHFYNLAIVYRDDYARAGYPMFPVVAGISAARRRILFTLGGTFLVTIVMIVSTPLAWLFASASILAGAVFFWSFLSQSRLRTRKATMQTFFVSIGYLGIVLGSILFEAVLLAS